MIKCAASIVINQSPAEVFRFVAQLENIPQWVRGVRVVVLSKEPVGDGTLFQQDHEVVRVDHFQVNQGFETQSVCLYFPIRLMVKQTHGILRFEPVGQGTQFTLTHHFELTPLLKPFERLLASKAQQESQAALEQLKALLEHR